MKHNFFLYAVHFAFVRLINKAAAMLTASAVPEWYGPFGLFSGHAGACASDQHPDREIPAAVSAGLVEAADRRKMTGQRVQPPGRAGKLRENRIGEFYRK